MREPPQWLGFWPPHRQHGFDVASTSQIKHAMEGKDAIDGRMPWRTQLHHYPNVISEPPPAASPAKDDHYIMITGLCLRNIQILDGPLSFGGATKRCTTA